MNRVDLVGRITKDPELKATSSNIYFVTFTLAVNRPFSQENSNQKADFIQCVVWRKTAENLARYVKKGALLSVEGRISTRTFEDQSGATRYITEVQADSVQYLERSDNTNRQQQSFNPAGNHQEDDNNYTDDGDDNFYESSKKLAADDDLPF